MAKTKRKEDNGTADKEGMLRKKPQSPEAHGKSPQLLMNLSYHQVITLLNGSKPPTCKDEECFNNSTLKVKVPVLI